jgi:hypothetical protein
MMRKALLASTVLSFVCASTQVHAAASNVCRGSNAPSFGVLPLSNNGIGQIFDMNGMIFVPGGIGIMEGQEASVSTLQGLFPGINFVRYAIFDYKDPAALAPYVTSLTNAGIVVELENHRNSTGGNAGGSQGVIFTGALLQQESDWYSALATYFKGNPRVWFGTNNEPSEAHTPGGPSDPAALSQWQQATYNAIRNTGNSSPIMLELNGGADPSSMGQGYDPSVYSQMYNVIWDLHFYGWLTNYNTDQAANNAFLAAAVKQGQSFTSSGSVRIPVLVGEYGNSTTGLTIDANGTQAVQAVHNNVLNGTAAGSAAWAWTTGNPGDGLLGGGGLSAYGQQVATFMQQHVAAPEVASSPSSCGGNTKLAAAGNSSTSSVTTISDGQPASNTDSSQTTQQQPSMSDAIAISNAQADAILQQDAAQTGSAGGDPETDASIAGGDAQLQAVQRAMAGVGQ